MSEKTSGESPVNPLPIAAAVYPTNEPFDASAETTTYSRSEAHDRLLSLGYTGGVAERFLNDSAHTLETMEPTSSAAKVLRAFLRNPLARRFIARVQAAKELRALGVGDYSTVQLLDNAQAWLSGENGPLVEAFATILRAYVRGLDAAQTDPLATVPAEERTRIDQIAWEEGQAKYLESGGSRPAAQGARDRAIAREVAAWHAERAARPPCRVCDRPRPDHGGEDDGIREDGVQVCDGYEPAAPETLPGLAPLTPSDEAAILAFRAGQAVTRELLATDARPAARVTEDELAEIERNAALLASTEPGVADFTRRAGAERRNAALAPRLARTVLALRALIVRANNALFDVGDEMSDPEHAIECHADTVPNAYRRLAKRASEAWGILAAEVCEMLEPTLRAELAARHAPAADASLEARAILAWRAWDESPPAEVDPVEWSDLPPAGQAAWLAVVRAVDASRPAPPTPEEDADEPLTRGTHVRTVARLTALFSPSLHPHRRPNASGKTVRRMTSGDIYYDVRHDDGTVAGYERSELIDLTAAASRPGLTEEQADAIALGCLQVRADLQRHAIKRAILRVDRGETGPASHDSEAVTACAVQDAAEALWANFHKERPLADDREAFLAGIEAGRKM